MVLRRHFSEVWQIGLSYIIVYQRYTHLSRQVKEHPQFKSEVRGLSAKVPLHYSLPESRSRSVQRRSRCSPEALHSSLITNHSSVSWFVLNHIAPSPRHQAQKAVDRFNTSAGTRLELFAPTYVVPETRNGQTHLRTANLTFHYVFVRGDFYDVKQLCGQDNGFSFLINRGSDERYATVSDRDMANFRNIARAYHNSLPYYPLQDIDLDDGDLVEVVNGDFPGLVGRFMPKAKSKSGDIVLSIFQGVGTVAFNIKNTDVRVLEFSSHTTRANDQIDAFVPSLLQAMRLFHAGEEIPQSLLAKLTIFARRMAVVKVNNRKLNAKLQALLYGANLILGDMTTANAVLTRYHELSTSITNPWTAALTRLILTVLATPEVLDISSDSLPETDKLSKFQLLISDQYEYYSQCSTI